MKRLGEEVRPREPAEPDEAARHAPLAHELPAAPPEDARGRLLQPDRVVIGDAPGREDHREGVEDERGVEVLQVPRPDHDRGHQQPRPQVAYAPARRRSAVRRRCGGSWISNASSRGRNSRALTRPRATAVSDEQHEPRPHHAQPVAEDAQEQRREEPAQAAHRAHQARDRAGGGGKYCGTSLKTAPLPRPRSAAQPSAPTVNGIIDGHARSSAKARRRGIRRAARARRRCGRPAIPRAGRISVARTTKPAVRNPRRRRSGRSVAEEDGR